MNTCSVSAAVTKDIYDAYSVDFHSSLSENVVDIIQQAEHAKIDAIKYNNVTSTRKPDLHLSRLHKNVETASSNLLHAGQLSYSDVIQAEVEYLRSLEIYNDARAKSQRRYKLNGVSINSVSVDAYNEALDEMNRYKQSQNIGTISMNIALVRNPASVQHSGNITVIQFYEPTQVLAPFNGQVTKATDDVIEISLPDDIRIRIKGVNQQIVQVGDIVHQNQVIGTARDLKLYAGLRIGDKEFSLKQVMRSSR